MSVQPHLLTVEKLKKELQDRGVTLPKGQLKKDVLVELYKQHVQVSPPGASSRPTTRGAGPVVDFDFSSDDDETFELGKSQKSTSGTMSNRKSVTTKESRSKTVTATYNGVDIYDLSDAELTAALRDYGASVGPIMATTRGVYQKKLVKLIEGGLGESPGRNKSTAASSSSQKVSQPAKAGASLRHREYSDDDDDMEVDDDDDEVDAKEEEMLVSAGRDHRTQTTYSSTATYRSETVRQRGQPQVDTAAGDYRPAGRPTMNYTAAPRTDKPTYTAQTPVPTASTKSKRLIPIWLQLTILAVVVIIIFLVVQNMESGFVNPVSRSIGHTSHDEAQDETVPPPVADPPPAQKVASPSGDGGGGGENKTVNKDK